MREYYNTAFFQSQSCLGLPLRPLCLGHIILLNAVESAFFTSEPITLADLCVSVWICSRSNKEASQNILNPDLPDAFGKWAGALLRPTTLHRFRIRKPIEIDWGAEIQNFSGYLREGMSGPVYSFDPGKSRTTGVPTPLSIKIELMSHLNLTEEQVMERPYKLCLWEFVALRAKEGLVRIVDEGALLKAMKSANEFAKAVNGARNN